WMRRAISERRRELPPVSPVYSPPAMCRTRYIVKRSQQQAPAVWPPSTPNVSWNQVVITFKSFPRMLKMVAQQGRRRVKPGGVSFGAHGATNKEHHVCARRRVGEAAGSPLRILSSRERC